ncbi:MAG: hypothetical protein JWN14_2471 [Chthonomonadales bacterium]|nr:hypothetical protein [Chthonomonadales bacterium]
MDYNFEDPSEWAKDPAGRSLHALHLPSGDVVSLDAQTYKVLFPARKKRTSAPSVTAETGETAGDNEEGTDPADTEGEGAEQTA